MYFDIDIIDEEDRRTIGEWVNFLFYGDSDDINFIRSKERAKYEAIKEKYNWSFTGMTGWEVLKQMGF